MDDGKIVNASENKAGYTARQSRTVGQGPGCHNVPEHASGARRKLARLVGREGGEEGEGGRGRKKNKNKNKMNKSSKDRTWSAVPDALLGVISQRSGVRAGQQPQRADVL